MSETSLPWEDGTGDGGAYSSDAFADFMAALASADGDNVGVVGGYIDSLEPSASGTDQVTMQAGAAFDHGRYYKNSAALPINMSRPGVGPTGKRLVLRADWTAQTIRATVISSDDGDTALPDLVQTALTTWDIPIASFIHASADGAISSFLDEREFTRPAKHNFVINGGGAVITTGIRPPIEIAKMTVTSYGIQADQPGSIVIDIAHKAGFNSLTFPTDSIVGGSPYSDKPTLSSAQSVNNTNLNNWIRKNLDDGWLGIKVESVAVLNWATLVVRGYRA